MAIRYIDIKQEVLSANDGLANKLRVRLKEHKTLMINVMSSPGAGKTTLLLDTIQRLREQLRIGVVEADIESMVDAEKIEQSGAMTVQIRTGGDCHIDAPMLKPALDTMNLDSVDLLFLENVGNLVCPAEFDTGATCSIMLLSVPEGDDNCLLYTSTDAPLDFRPEENLVRAPGPEAYPLFLRLEFSKLIEKFGLTAEAETRSCLLYTSRCV